jgi:hypothetical protein
MEKRNKENARRYRKARADARVGSIIASIEKNYGLPVGAVLLVLPNGRKARTDGKISNIRKKWDQ